MTNLKRKLSKFILELDYFSLPIQLTLDNHQKAKKTLLGGIFTILIGIASLSYLTYLCNIYFSHQIQPAISTTSEYIEKQYEMNVYDDMIGFRIRLNDGQYLQDYEKQRGGRRLVSFSISYNTTEGILNFDKFKSTPCKNQDLLGYMCINMKSINTSIQYDYFKLTYNETNKFQNLLILHITKCNERFIGEGEVCEDDDMLIQKKVFEFGVQFQVKMLMKKYNPISKQFEKKVKLENYLFDDELMFVSSFQFMNVQTKINDGFLIQQTKIENHFSEYQKSDSSLTQKYVKRVLKMECYGGFYITVGTNNIIQSIQYSQFSSVLAQFMCVLNTLLAIRFICKKFTEYEIIQDLLSIQLKFYYKKTALKIIKNSEKNKQQNYELQNKYKLLKSISDSNIIQKAYDFFKIGIFQRFKLNIFFKREVKHKKSDSNEIKAYKSLQSQSAKLLNIYQIQQELLKLKIMMRLMLTTEQYAAIQLCGCRIQTLDKKIKFENKVNQNQSSKQKKEIENIKLNILESNDQIITENITDTQNIQKKQKNSPNTLNVIIESPKLSTCTIENQQEDDILNHLEIIENIENDQDLLQQHINKFLVNNKVPKSELNKRIIQSMIGIDVIENEDKL